MEVKKQQMIVLLFSMFIFTLGFGIIIPVLPYFSRSLGATAFDLGLLMASYSLMQFLLAPSWGKLSDRFGRKPVLGLGLLGFGISFIIFGISDSLWMLFISRIFGGAMSAGIFPASLAIISDITKPRDRGKAMGWMGAAMGMGMIFGPAISGVISVFGLSAPFFAAGILSILTMIFSYLILPESFKRSVLDENKDNKMSMLSPLKAPIAIFFIMTFIISLVMAAFQGSIAYFTMDRFGLADIPSPIPLVFFLESDISLSGPGSMAVICTVMGLMSAICQGFLVNKLINKFSEEKTIFYGLALSAVGLALFLISADFLSLVIFSGIFSIGSGLVTPCINAIISNRTDQSRQGAIMGFVGSYNGLGRIIGPPAGGFLYDINIFIPYLLTAVISAFSAIAVYVFIKKDKKAIIEQEIKILK